MAKKILFSGIIWLILTANGYCRLQHEIELAQKFCPSLQLHSKDQGVAPKSVDIMSNGRADGITKFLDENDLWCKTFNLVGEDVGDFSITDRWEVVGFNKWPPGSIYYNTIYNKIPIKIGGRPPGKAFEKYFIFFHYDFGGSGRNSPDTWYEDYRNFSDLYTDTIYAHVFPLGNKAVIQYWFFYPFNDWVNNHEGDWEHINVCVSSQDPAIANIEYVDYYFHFQVKTCTQPGIDFFVDDQTHPVVFVGGHGEWKKYGMVGSGEGSHGCYPVKGHWDDVVRIYSEHYVSEDIDGTGEYLSYRGFDLKIIPNIDEIVYGQNSDLYWMRSNVLWGHRDCDSPGDWIENTTNKKKEIGNSPPKGPAFNGNWNNTGVTSAYDGHSYDKYSKSAPYSPVTNSDYTLPIVGLIQGIVTNKEGKPVSGATIKVSNKTRSATTDKDGRYKIALPVGSYEIYVKAAKEKEGKTSVRLNQGDIIQANFRWERSITGKAIRIANNQSIPKVKIEILQSNQVKVVTFTDQDGIYRISNLPVGDYDIRATIDIAIQEKKVTVKSGQEAEVDFAFDDYVYGGNNSKTICRWIWGKRTNTYYLSPSDPSFQLYKWDKDTYYRDKAKDAGTYIDYANNRLAIRIKFNPKKWWQGAMYYGKYMVYGRKQVNFSTLPKTSPYNEKMINRQDTANESLPVVSEIEPLLTEKQMATIVLMPILEKSSRVLFNSPELEQETKIGIMIKNVESEIETAKIKISFDPNRIQIKEVETPVFENPIDELKKKVKENNIDDEIPLVEPEIKVYQRSNIDHNRGQAEINIAIERKGDMSWEKEMVVPNNLSSATIINRALSINSSIEEGEREEEEDTAPIAYLVLKLPQSVIAYSPSLNQTIMALSIDEAELWDKDRNVIKVKIEKNNLINSKTESMLEKAYCYPNPTKGDEITFNGLTNNVKVKIYNIAGELIYEGEWINTGGSYKWNCVNKDSNKLASGSYIYVLTDSVSQSIKRGKLAIIR